MAWFLRPNIWYSAHILFIGSIHKIFIIHPSKGDMGGKITKVVPGLYIGANENAKHDEQLIANCISHILSVQSSDTQIERVC